MSANIAPKIVIILLGLFLAGCALNLRHGDDGLLMAANPPESSPLRLRQLQVRDFPTDRGEAVMRAVIASLQDEGFTITGADAGLGLISAKLDTPPGSDEPRRRRGRYWFAAGQGGDIVSTRLEASISVYSIGAGTRIRLGFVTRKTGGEGSGNTQTVEDPEIYRNMFARVERAIFYELQRL